MIDVSVIIVSMNRPDLLSGCLAGMSIEASHETLVVAYRYSPENLAAVRERYPSVRFIEQPDLAGFSENNNFALREARGRYCFIVNDDTLQEEHGPVVDRLLADFDRLPSSAAAISPKIVFPGGRVQTCGRAPWTAWRWMRHYLHLVDETRPTKWSMKEGLFETRTLNGACFLIRTDAFRAAGWFDERFVFTPEDIALGRKLCDMGYTLWTDADVSITHLAGATVGSSAVKRLSPMEAVIKPVRVRGALIYYSGGCGLRYFGLGCFVWGVELLRGLKYQLFTRPCCRSNPDSIPSIRIRTARNIRRRAIFTRRSAKELFLSLYEHESSRRHSDL